MTATMMLTDEEKQMLLDAAPKGWRQIHDEAHEAEWRLMEGLWALRIAGVRDHESRSGKPRVSWKLECPVGHVWYHLTQPDSATAAGEKWRSRDAFDGLGVSLEELDDDPAKALEPTVGQVWLVKVRHDGPKTLPYMRRRLPDDTDLGLRPESNTDTDNGEDNE